MSMRADAVVVPLAESFPEEINGVKIITKGVLGPDENEDVEREVIASTTGVVDSVVDSVINGEGHTLVSPSSTEGVTTEDNSVEEVESPSETTAAASKELSNETKAAIVKQVEFYFSDENLPTDAFMKKKLKAGGAQGWVPVKVIAGFPKIKKLSKNAKAIGSVLDALSNKLVVQGSRVRRKTPFVLDKEGMADVTKRTVVAVNIPANSTIESLTLFFSACGVAENVRIIRDEGQNSKGKEIHPPVGPHRKFYATCQYSTLEEAIRAVNELTDRSIWRGGLRVTLANGVTVEKALARLKSSGGKKSRPEREGRSPPGREAISSRPKAHDHDQKGKGVRNVRNGQPRSRSLTELELEAVASSTRVAPRVDPLAGNQTNSVQGKAHEDVKSNAGDGSDIPNGTARKLRSVSNVDAASFETRGGGGSGVFEETSPPRHNNTSTSDGLLRKGVVQTIVLEGCSWIKKDGNGSRKGGGRIPFWMADVVIKDGEQQQQQQHPLQKGDHVEFRTWRGNDGKVIAVRVERIKERSRAVGSNGSSGNGGGSGFRATQAHFRMAVGPEEGQSGFAVGRGRRIRGSSIGGPGTKEFIPVQLGGLSGGVNQRPRGSSVGGVAPEVGDDNVGTVRRPRGSSMGGPDSVVFVPASLAASRFEDSD